MNPTTTASPIGGDPSKPGAWTQEQIDAWNAVKNCDHHAFWSTNPRATDDLCPNCNGIVRVVPTSPEGWIDHWAEQRAEERPYR